ncbi:MAG TPA: methionyl-tRNA formyltransferase [Syntrophobacteraceae bacterium]|nr:methionyl-tRNA formyltransferase [Syntrophobacteraceae bacterium]
MRIVVMGQAAFGAKFVEEIAAKKNVIAVYGPPDSPKGKPDPMKEMAVGKNLPYVSPRSYKGPEVLADFRQLQPDLLVMAFVTPIIPADFLAAPSMGSINYHPSLLPRHRGASAINWAVIMGDVKTGLTIFWPDGGIDTGPILLQKQIEIGWEDTTGSLYFNHLFPLGISALMESVELVEAGKAPRLPQDEARATYEPICDDKFSVIDWSKPGKEVYNLVRGCDPQPGAYALYRGQRVHFYSPKFKAGQTSEPPGTILQCDEKGLAIAVSEGVLEIAKVRPAGEAKTAALDFFKSAGLNAGDRF